MSKYYEYNPHNGVTEVSEFQDDGTVTVYQQEDVEDVVKICQASRNQGIADKGIKENWFCYAKLPTTICYELMKKGLNPFDRNVSPQRLEQEIRRNYPHFLTTDKRAT